MLDGAGEIHMKKNYLTTGWVVAALAVICCMLWGSAITTIKTGYRLMDIDSSDTAAIVLFAGLRFALAGLLVIGFECIRQKKIVRPTVRAMRLACPLCLAQTVGQYYFFYIGVAHTSGVKGSIITGLGYFFAILMSCLVFRIEKMTRRKFAGCVLGFAGVIVINLMGDRLDMGFRLSGEGALLLSQMAYALSTVLINLFSKKESPVLLSGCQFFIGGLIMTGIGCVMGGRINRISGTSFLILLYLAFVSAAAYTLWSVLLAHNTVSKVAIYGFVNPLCSVLLSAIVLGEITQAFNAGTLTALLLVTGGICIVNWKCPD